MATSNITPQAAPAAPVASTESAPQSPAPAYQPVLPTPGNWQHEILNAEPTQVAQPVESAPSPQPEPQKEEVAVEPAAGEQAPAAEATAEIPEVNKAELGESDAALYQRIMDDLAAQHPGVDPKFLGRAADAQFQVVKMREKVGEQAKDITRLLKDVKKVYKPAVITQLEQSVAAPAAAPAPATPEPTAQPQAAPAASQPAPQGDPVMALLQSWQSADDVVQSERDAWNSLNEATTPQEARAANEKIALIRAAQNRRELLPLMQALPAIIKEQAEQLFRERFGDIMPVMKETVEQRRAAEDLDAACNELEQAGATGVRDLFKEEPGELEYNGQKWANSAYNKIIAENPELLDIVVSHKDPRTANRLTLIRRMKMAMRLAGVQQAAPAEPHKEAALTPEQAASLEALTAQAKRELASNQTRQTLNAGPGASSAAPSPEKPFMGYAASGRITAADFYQK